jgi:putative effector of murein hydrolase LrgA (UPF0299 family)
MKLKREWVFAWAALRLPLLALAVYFLRYQIVEWFEGSIGFTGRMEFFIFTVSTLPTRLILFLACSAALGFWYWLTTKLNFSTGARYSLWLAGAYIGIFIFLKFLFLVRDAVVGTCLLTALLAVNSIPFEWLEKRFESAWAVNLIFLSAVGLAETFLPQTYAIWLAGYSRKENLVKTQAWMVGIPVAALFWVFLILPYDNQRVFTLTERLYADPAVQKFAPGIFNWVELNPEKDLLYAVGRGTNFLLAFDVNDLKGAPLRSQEDIGKTQSFAFNPERQEIYIYKAETRELVYMDASTLEVFRRIPVEDLSPGDVWIKWLATNDTIILSSEADAEIGVPLYVFDRESGRAVASMPFPVIPTAYLIFHPEKPWMYFNSFKDPYFAIWDMGYFEIIKQVEITPRTDRMIFSEAENEVWVASPLDGAIMRYDADTLGYAGRIKSTLGDRTLTLDTRRNLLLAGNFMNGRLEVIDLATEKSTASYYLGPWIRTIALDIENGIAYVSTVRGLFKVEYAAP